MDMICINCPMGCMLTVEKVGEEIQVTGNICSRGKNYAYKECTNPTRIVTSSVFVDYGEIEVVSVKTQRDIPKEKIFSILNVLKEVRVVAPVHVGDIIIENIVGTGVNIVATKEVEKIKSKKI